MFPWNFAGLLPVNIYAYIYASQIAMTASPMISGPNSPDLSPLDYQVCGNVGVFSQAAIEAENSSRV